MIIAKIIQDGQIITLEDIVPTFQYSADLKMQFVRDENYADAILTGWYKRQKSEEYLLDIKEDGTFNLGKDIFSKEGSVYFSFALNYPDGRIVHLGAVEYYIKIAFGNSDAILPEKQETWISVVSSAAREAIKEDVELVKEKATESSDNAKSALESAGVAQSSANAALEAEKKALEFASSAERFKNSASNFAEQANASKTEAQQSATNASNSASNALTNANKAKEHLDSVNTTVNNFNTDYTEKINEFNTDYTIKKENFDTAVNNANTALNATITEANTAINNKVVEATEQADRAESEANRAQLVTDGKLDKNQGTENAGKALVVGNDGNIVPIEMSASVKDYNNLENKPSINGVELKGQLTSEDLGIIAKADNILKGEIKKSLNPSVDDSFKREFWNLKMYGKSTQITTTGKNICDRFVGDNANDIVASSNIRSFNMKCEPNTTYTATIYQGSNNRFGFFSGVYEGDDLTNITKNSTGSFSTYSGGIATRTITTVEGDNVIWVYLDNNNQSLDDVVVQVEKGEESTSYESYTGGKPSPSPEYEQEITKIEKFAIDINNGGYLLKGSYDNKIIPLKLEKGKTYKIYVGHNSSVVNAFVLNEEKQFNDSGNLYVYGRITKGLRVNETGVISEECAIPQNLYRGYIFTVTVDGLYLYQSVNKASLNTDDAYVIYNEKAINVDVSYKTQLFKYTPTQNMYSTQDGSISDYVDVEKGVEVYTMGGEVIDGSGTTSTPFGNPTVGYGFYKNVPNMVKQTNGVGWCNKAKVGTTGSYGATPTISFGSNNNVIYVTGIFTEQKTKEEIIAWLSENPLFIVYPLATPTEITIDEEQLAILRKLYSYEGVTNFLCNGEVSCNYEISHQINNEKMWQAINANKLNIATM